MASSKLEPKSETPYFGSLFSCMIDNESNVFAALAIIQIKIMQLKHSNQIILAVLSSGLSAHLTVTLQNIAKHAKKTPDGWIAFPTLETLAKLSGKSVRTISQHVKQLTNLGYIKKSKARHKQAQHLHNVYTINISLLGFTKDLMKVAKKPVQAVKRVFKRPTKQTRITPVQAALLLLQNRKATKSDAQFLLDSRANLSVSELHEIDFIMSR